MGSGHTADEPMLDDDRGLHARHSQLGTSAPSVAAEESDETTDGAQLRCDPCDQSFTTKRALTRHRRQNKRHRADDEDSGRLYKCRLCHMTTPRAYDLRRHEREQHADETATCLFCSIQYRPGDHCEEQCVAEVRNREIAVVMVDGAISAMAGPEILPQDWNLMLDDCLKKHASLLETDDRTDMTPCRDLSEQASHEVCDSKDGDFPTDPPRAASQGHTLRYNSGYGASDVMRPICGHCHKMFEQEKASVAQHLEGHWNELKQTYKCHLCDAKFVRKQDFAHHQRNSSSGHCGFQFNHTQPCSGHHPILSADHEAFCLKLSEWEQSQLQLFSRSVASLLEYQASRVSSTHPEFDRISITKGRRTALIYVDYNARMGPMVDHPNGVNDRATYSDSPLKSFGKRLHPRHAFRRGSVSLAKTVESSLARLTNGVSELNPIGSSSRASSGRQSGDTHAFARALVESSRDSDGHSLLHYFAKENNGSALALLLANGIDPDDGCPDRRAPPMKNYAPESPLHKAIFAGSVEAVEELLSHGARTDLAGLYGDPPLYSALLWNKDAVFLALIAGGADVNARNTYSDETALHVAAGKGDDITFARELLIKGADVNARSCVSGNTPLHVAASRANRFMTRLLLEYGADLYTKDAWGETPWDYARRPGNQSLRIEMLKHASRCMPGESSSDSACSSTT